jgi:hypothetical protein
MGYEIAYVSLLVSSEVVQGQADLMNRPASSSLRLKIKERLGMMDEICDSIGLKYASQQVSRLVQLLEAASTTPVQIASATRHLHDLILDQMKEKIFLFVPDEQAAFLKQHAFGKNITDAFPSSTFDVSEAGACYASARWTACVFHLMRSLEVGLARRRLRHAPRCRHGRRAPLQRDRKRSHPHQVPGSVRTKAVTG